MKLKLNDKMPWGAFKDLTLKEVIDTKPWYWKKWRGELDLDEEVLSYLKEIGDKVKSLKKTLKYRF